MNYRFFKSAAAVFAVMTAFIPLTAGAAQFKNDPSGTVSVNEAISDDLYAAGGSVSLNSSIAGDAVLAGGNLLIIGPVNESILAGGGTVAVLGNTGDDLRMVGGNIMMNGSVAHDAIVLGGQVSIASNAAIGKDLVVLGGTVTVDAPVNGNVFIRGSEVNINSAIGGSANIKADSIVFGPRASIGGRLVYSSPSEAVIGNELAKGGVEYVKMIRKETSSAKGAMSGLLAVGIFIKLITIIVLGLIIAMIFKRRSSMLQQSAFNGFWMNFLYGFSVMILIPIASLILLVTIIGAPVALVMMAVYGILFALSGIMAPIMIGGWIFKFSKKTSEYPTHTYSIIVGAVVFTLIGIIPFVGWIFGGIFIMAALGTLARSAVLGLNAARNR